MQTDSNPYAAPRTPLAEQATRLRITAVLVGAAIANGIYFGVMSVLGLGYFWLLVLQGVPTDQLYAHAYASTPYIAFAHVVGFACMVPGGYWSARLSPNAGKAAAQWAAVVLSALAALDYLSPYEFPVPLWSRLASLLGPFPAFWFGAVLWSRDVEAPAQSGSGDVC
ncbi:hypothetical protein [uncultured Aquimonas sp.]|uniref:hypothetical protein n=1 Tax=uncultured Aquimonas sp. TaxID=385483 RepID=UPI00086CF210|nr:hypothetical protein [uncultured Aquimonas sp.]ODU46710.1 MAG: hypothetical protein ABS96_08100 [Xanthomonadaceae bacterium SCN 69-123]